MDRNKHKTLVDILGWEQLEWKLWVNWKMNKFPNQLEDKWELLICKLRRVVPISIDKLDMRGWGLMKDYIQ